MTSLDLHASNETLIRNYEMVRQNIGEILPDLPSFCVIEIIASNTPHNPAEIPLLGLHTPLGSSELAPDEMDVQDSIDEWFAATPADRIQELLDKTNVPTWNELLKHGVYPFPDGKQRRITGR